MDTVEYDPVDRTPSQRPSESPRQALRSLSRLILIPTLLLLLAPMTAQAQTVTFAAVGDFGDDSAAEGDVAALIGTFSPDFIVTTGDNNYTNNGTTGGWDSVVGDYYGSYVAYPAGSSSSSAPGATTNAFFPALGNHDWDAGGFEAYFDLPGAGIPTSGTSGNERYYDFVQGPVHFFMIDSDGREPDGITSTSTQAQWLQAQLAASTSPWKLVFMHHPPYGSSSNHGSTPALQWPYEAWGASAVFAGHDHLYERIIRDENTDGVDLPYFTTGAGGRSLYSFGTPLAGSEVRYNSNYGTMMVTATSASITFEFYSIAGGGTLIDTYTMTNDALVCEAFDAFPVGDNVGDDANWFDDNSGPVVNASGGVGGSQGLDPSGTIFTWTSQPINWTDPETQGVVVQLDLETDGSGNLDDDRVGWMITDVSSGSDNIFGIQADPGGSGPGPNIEAYWDGDSFGDDGGRTSIVSLPALNANTFYRLRADITKLTATSVRIDATLTELDGAGNEVGVVGSGSILDTDLLPNTAGEEIPNPAYFTASTIWPAYKNHTGAAANADNACYAVLTDNTPPPVLSAGDLIIAGIQPTGSGEYIEIFNTTSEPISLQGLQIVSRVSTGNVLNNDWVFAPNLAGEVIQPYSFYLFAESPAPAENGNKDFEGSLDLATGEGGVGETAIGLQLSLNGAHMDHVLYGYSLGSNSNPVPDGDIAFGGSYPRNEVIWNTLGGSSFAEGSLQRLSQSDLYAGHAVDGFYTDEGSLAGSNPVGVWTSPHDGSTLSPARNSTSAAVPPPAVPAIIVGGTPLASFSAEPGTPSAEQSYTVAGSNLSAGITIMAPADFEVSTTSGSGFSSMVTLPESGGTVSTTTVYVRFNKATSGPSSGDLVHTSTDAPQVDIPVSGLAQPALTAGSVIISGFQAWNTPGADNPGEFIELFNTTGNTIFLDNMEIITRVDNEPNGSLDTDWQLSNEGNDLSGLSIAPYSFFLIAESDVDGEGPGTGVHDVDTNMDLATGEGGAAERAIGIQLLIGGVHMDHVLYGRADGSDTAGIPDGDIAFGGTYPRVEVIRNTTGDDSYQEGIVWRVSQEALHAGHDVNGFYTDEAALGDGNPAGVWTSPHDELDDSYEARNSSSAAVPPPSPIPPDAPTDLTAVASGPTSIDLNWTDASSNEDDFEVERSDDGSPGSFTLLVTLPAGTESYVDMALDSEEDYCYRVRATNVFGESGYTTEECATTEATSPRVVDDLLVLYTFEEGTGTTINDVSGVGAPLNLQITSGTPTWDVAGAINVSAPALMTSGGAASKVISGVQSSSEISLEAWVTPANTTQFGPARMMALSGGAVVGSNFVLGPGPGSGDVTKYDTRLRTTSTNQWGNNPSLTTAAGVVSTSLTHIVYTRSAAGTTTMYINGAPVANGSVGGTMANWANYALTLANEPSNDRAWLGQMHLVAIYNRALTPAEVTQNFDAGKDGNAEPPTPTYTLAVNVVGNGSVSRDPDQATYDEDTVVELTATPAAGWLFTGWSGDITSVANPVDVTMDANKTVTATFTEVSTELAGSLLVEEVGSGAQINLEFGTDGAASDGTDVPLDLILPPPPPGLLDARFICPADNVACSDDLLNDYRGLIAEGQTIVWRVKFQRETASSDVLLDWSGSTFPGTGSFMLVDPLGGFADIDMLSQDSYTVTNDALTEVRIVYSLSGSAGSFAQSFAEGWNLIGLPLAVADNSVAALYPAAVGGTLYGFDPSAGYQAETALDLGAGYWLNFGSAGSETVNGTSVQAVSVNLPSGGWHLIAGPACTVSAGSIADPAGILTPNTLFGFNGLTYVLASNVQQGQGYWVRSDGAGQIQMACSAPSKVSASVAAAKSASDATPEGFGELVVGDESGAERALLFGGTLDASLNIVSFGLPPVPPVGAFDVRFEGDTRLVQETDAVVRVQSSAFPITVQLLSDPDGSGGEFVIEAMTGTAVVESHTVVAGSSFTINNANVTSLRLSKAVVEEVEIPDTFALVGAYPNPFSSTVTILIDTPEDAEVEVTLVDLLGRTVQTVPRHVVAAGTSQGIQLTVMPELASGLYFFRVSAETANGTYVKAGRITLAR